LLDYGCCLSHLMAAFGWLSVGGSSCFVASKSGGGVGRQVFFCDCFFSSFGVPEKGRR
jgi:hypothetical protein